MSFRRKSIFLSVVMFAAYLSTATTAAELVARLQPSEGVFTGAAFAPLELRNGLSVHQVGVGNWQEKPGNAGVANQMISALSGSPNVFSVYTVPEINARFLNVVNEQRTLITELRSELESEREARAEADIRLQASIDAIGTALIADDGFRKLLQELVSK